MSRMTETITLQPTRIGGKEHFFSGPQECPHCGGRGHYCPEGPNDEAPECKHCAGTGKLQAIVDIAWVPANRWRQGFDGSANSWEMDEQTRLKILRR